MPIGLCPVNEGSNDFRKINLGHMSHECQCCHALHWLNERQPVSPAYNPTFGRCCYNGKVVLPFLQAVPDDLKVLYRGETDDSQHFLKHIRQYNAAFAMVSLGVKVDRTVVQGQGPPVYRIHGELTHALGQLLPGESGNAKYAQIYFLDPTQAVEARNRNNSN
ncbi:hypothetical protein B0H19DRAFT_946379, partial [Mycena capillaripes]